MATWKRVMSLLLCAALVLAMLPAMEGKSKATVQLTGMSTNYTLTGKQATDIVRVAQAQEGKSGADLGVYEGWCADFVFSCARAAGISASIIPTTGSVTTMYNQILNNGGTIVSSPREGDLIFYAPESNTHVGIMIDSTNSVHGNVNGVVTICPYTWYRNVNGVLPNYVFVRPNYSSYPPPTIVTEVSVHNDSSVTVSFAAVAM